jgi:hypothetical protein
MERKFIRNTQILKNELEKDPKNIYYWFQLSQSYEGYELYDDALEACLMAYELAKEQGNISDSINIYNHLARVYFLIKKYDEVEEICLEAMAQKGGYIDIVFLLAKSQKQIYRNMEAIKNFNIYLDMSSHYEDFAGFKDTSVPMRTLGFHEEAYTDLCMLYSREKQYEKVLDCKEKIQNIDLLRVALPAVINAYVKLNKYAELKEFYDSRILNASIEIAANFTDSLETEITALSKQNKKVLMDIFSCGENIYATLSNIRLKNRFGKSNINKTFIAIIERTDFNRLPAYYSEVLNYLIKNKELQLDVLKHLSNTTLEKYFSYLIQQFKKECADYVLQYMQENIVENTIDDIRIRKTLAKILLLSGTLGEEKYEGVFKQYAKDGILYIKQLYNKGILLDERIAHVKDEEEAMLLYLDHAEEVKAHDKVAYVRYLKKALAIYPAMAAGIEIYLKNLAEELNDYKKTIKENIKAMIDTGNLLRAHKLIYEYERVQKDDIQILSMKAVIAIMEDCLEEAKAIIKEGLGMEPKNFDLLYNLKYVYEVQGQEEKAEHIQKRIAFSMPTARYIDSNISLREFFENINEERIRYVVIRGYEELPDIGQGDSMTLLVHDEDLVKISKYFMPDQVEGAILCEVYTIREIPGSMTAALPDHSIEAAEAVLRDRVLCDGLIYIPGAQA